MTLALLTALAFGQSSATLTDGTPEFGCTAPDACPQFYSFLSHAMVEQGFALEHVDTGAPAYHLPYAGLRLGGSFATFPFTGARENLSGKEENTEFSPVLPRLQLGGSQLVGDWVVSADLALTPPVPVGGASAFVASMTLGAGRAVHARVRIGGELECCTCVFVVLIVLEIGELSRPSASLIQYKVASLPSHAAFFLHEPLTLYVHCV